MFNMFALLVAAGLATAQPGPLALTNVRTTYGVLGPARPDNNFLPGDKFVLSFDIEGAKVSSEGKISYSIGMQVNTADGKVLFKQAPRENDAVVAPGTEKLPACASLEIGTSQPPGKYNFTVTVTDRLAGVTREVSQSCQLLPAGFGIVRPALTRDPEGKFAAATLSKGKAGWMNFAVVGFGRDRTKDQPKVALTMNIVDDTGRAVLSKPSSGTVDQGIPDKVLAFQGQFEIVLQQTGSFTVQLQASDQITGEKATLSFPVRVAPSEAQGRGP